MTHRSDVCEALQPELLDVLYDEAPPAVRGRVEDHLAGCARCRAELEQLRAVRRDLREWRVPEPLIPRTAPRAPRTAPAGLWRLAAAAVLVLAVGGALGLSGLSFRYARGPFEVQLGRGGEAALLARLEAQERRHREEIAALRRSLEARPASATAGSERLLEQVARMIEESESRQQERFETAWADFGRQAEAQRRYDLARISAGLSYLDSKAGAQAARTSELVGYLIDAADRR